MSNKSYTTQVKKKKMKVAFGRWQKPKARAMDDDDDDVRSSSTFGEPSTYTFLITSAITYINYRSHEIYYVGIWNSQISNQQIWIAVMMCPTVTTTFATKILQNRKSWIDATHIYFWIKLFKNIISVLFLKYHHERVQNYIARSISSSVREKESNQRHFILPQFLGSEEGSSSLYLLDPLSSSLSRHNPQKSYGTLKRWQIMRGCGRSYYTFFTH